MWAEMDLWPLSDLIRAWSGTEPLLNTAREPLTLEILEDLSGLVASLMTPVKLRVSKDHHQDRRHDRQAYDDLPCIGLVWCLFLS